MTARFGDARRAAFEKARTRWPSVELSFEQFSQHLEHHGWSNCLPGEIESFYLCTACGLGSEAACRSIDRFFFPALKAAIAHQYRDWDFVQEVLQLTRERLLVRPAKRITTYRGDGSLAAWLRRVANRVALDMRRRHLHIRCVLFDEQLLLSNANFRSDAESFTLQGHESDTAGPVWLKHALSDAIVSVGASHRRLLRMFYVQRLSANQIGARLNIDRSTVYRQLNHVLLRIERRLVVEARRRTGIFDRVEVNKLLRHWSCQIHLDPLAWSETQSLS